MSDAVKKRKIIRSEGRAIIAKVYHFLKEEYNFMKENNYDNCDLSPLAHVRKRTAQATGVSQSTVTAILKEEREGWTTINDQQRTKRSSKEKVTKRKAAVMATEINEPSITVLKQESDCNLNPLANVRNRGVEETEVRGTVTLKEEEFSTTSSQQDDIDIKLDFDNDIKIEPEELNGFDNESIKIEFSDD